MAVLASKESLVVIAVGVVVTTAGAGNGEVSSRC